VVYKSKYGLLPGTSYEETMRVARKEFHKVQKRNPRRQPYVRSRYFSTDKVFINIFWNHLVQKRKGEQMKRAKLLASALDLIRNTSSPPETILKQGNLNEILHRFKGISSDGTYFYIQIRQNKKTGRKDFMSVFPAKETKIKRPSAG